MRLHDRLARHFAAAGAPGDLGQELKRALRGSEIRHPEPDVGRDHTHERNPRKIVALGNHLRPDQHVNRAVAEAREQISEGAASPNGVPVDSRDTRAGQALFTSASTRSVPKPA